MTNDKLTNTVLYLLRRAPHAGLTKLLKLIYFTDYHHYQRHLAPVTGVTYVALERGPAMDRYEEKLAAIESTKAIEHIDVAVFGCEKLKREYTAKIRPNTDAFSEAELETLAYVVQRYGGMSGRKLSRMTHEEYLPWSLVWDATWQGREIPLSLFRWSDNMPSEETVAKAKSRLANIDLSEMVD